MNMHDRIITYPWHTFIAICLILTILFACWLYILKLRRDIKLLENNAENIREMHRKGMAEFFGIKERFSSHLLRYLRDICSSEKSVHSQYAVKKIVSVLEIQQLYKIAWEKGMEHYYNIAVNHYMEVIWNGELTEKQLKEIHLPDTLKQIYTDAAYRDVPQEEQLEHNRQARLLQFRRKQETNDEVPNETNKRSSCRPDSECPVGSHG